MIKEIIIKHKLALALAGDALVFFAALTLVLYGRYGGLAGFREISADNLGFESQFLTHLTPMLVVLLIWITIFYIANLYTYKAFQNILEIARRISTTLVISFFITITIFYIFSRFFSLTPKANLVMFTVVFGILDIAWRYLLRKLFIQKNHCTNIIILASSPLTQVVSEQIISHPQLGFRIHQFNSEIKTLAEKVANENIRTIIINSKNLRDRKTAETLYKLLPQQVEIKMLTDFYEELFNCIPLSEIEEEWFIKEITENKAIYESVKRIVEVIFSSALLVLLSPVFLVAGGLIKLSSKGPVIYKQERIGKGNAPFVLYKFRTMKDGEDGPLWTRKGDSRVTALGQILRHTHIDEFPQLWNIIKGEMSFVGPRAERTELVEAYAEIPYYEIRHIIKPGLVGWAQLNYKPSTSVVEARHKFQFDLFYLKNRSFVLDVFIVLKTIKRIVR